jgi:ribulose 1,5-bisphosphate synthetase/thiazole synthase
MGVCAAVGGSRTGALFEAMLMSGKQVGALFLEAE